MGEKVIPETQISALDSLLEELALRVLPMVNQKTADGFLNMAEASKYLGDMAEQTIREKVAQGLIKAYKPGRHPLFDKKELREYVKRHVVNKK